MRKNDLARLLYHFLNQKARACAKVLAEFCALVCLTALGLTLYCIGARVALDLPYPAYFPALLAVVALGAAVAAGIECAGLISRHKKGTRMGVISSAEIRRILEGKHG